MWANTYVLEMSCKINVHCWRQHEAACDFSFSFCASKTLFKKPATFKPFCVAKKRSTSACGFVVQTAKTQRIGCWIMQKAITCSQRNRNLPKSKLLTYVCGNFVMTTQNSLHEVQLWTESSCSCEASTSVANLAVFPRIWNCFFVELRVFWRLAGSLVLGLFLCRILFCGFFSKFTALLLFQCTAKGNLDVFLCEFAHFELVFPISPPCFCFTCCCFHCFFQFSYQTHFGHFLSVKLPNLGLFVRFACLILQNNLAPLRIANETRNVLNANVSQRLRLSCLHVRLTGRLTIG